MIKVRLSFLVMILGLHLTGGAQASLIETELNKIEMQVCSQDQKKCMKMSADKVVSSGFGNVQALQHIKAEVSEKGKTNGKSKLYSSEQGYVDFDSERIVLSGAYENGQMKETEIPFKTLDPRVRIMK